MIPRSPLDDPATAAFAWAVVGIPLAWGIRVTLSKSLTLFN